MWKSSNVAKGGGPPGLALDSSSSFPWTLKCVLGKCTVAHLWRHLAKPLWSTDLPKGV